MAYLLAIAFLLAPQDKAPVPGEAVREKILRQMKEIFAGDYAKRDAEDRAKFSEKLLAEAAKLDAGTEQYVMLTEARDLAAAAGNVPTAFRAIRMIVKGYDMRSVGPEGSMVAQKLKALEVVRKTARPGEARSAIAREYLNLAREGVERGDFEGASTAARNAASVAYAARERDLADEARELGHEINKLKKDAEEIREAELKLTVNPNDPGANLVLGRFLCFVRNDWPKGLPFLAKGADEGLKAVAAKELGNPQETEAQIALGDAWNGLAGKERDETDKTRYQQRSRVWYELAYGKAEGLVRLSLERKIGNLPKPRASERPLPAVAGMKGALDLMPFVDAELGRNLGNWQIVGRELRSPRKNEGCIYLRIVPPEEYDLSMNVTPQEGAKGFRVGISSGSERCTVVIQNHLKGAVLSGLSRVGDKGYAKNETTTPKKVFSVGRTHALKIAVRTKGILITVDGERFIQWEGDWNTLKRSRVPGFDQRWRNPVLAIGSNGVYHIGEFRLKPVSGALKDLRN